uniref:Putative secreted peptide n=1 Tax=Anopheles braziliensis TaxID=58242 RepID=A0A2M3ZMI0_9DIPT
MLRHFVACLPRCLLLSIARTLTAGKAMATMISAMVFFSFLAYSCPSLVECYCLRHGRRSVYGFIFASFVWTKFWHSKWFRLDIFFQTYKMFLCRKVF